MSKQYGLIHPKQDAPKLVKLSAFDSDSDSDTKESTSKKPNISIGLTQKKQIARAHNAALMEDPTIFQYDELFDDIKNERESAKVVKKSEQKTVKYIGKLLESADRRKKEYERRIERQVQKERETEGEMYKDKEAFVTSSYKQKLEEMKKAEDEEKRFDYLEAIGDVTKQRDLGGFYRHLYEQKMGPKAAVDTKKIETDATSTPEDEDNDDEPIKIKKTKEQVKKDRVYRKRKSSTQDASEGEDEEAAGADTATTAKKAHLQSNLDADSDFSIDSDSDEEGKPDNESVKVQHHATDVPTKNESQPTSVPAESHAKSENVTKVDEKVQSIEPQIAETKVEDVIVEEQIKDEPKIDIKKIWEKRTVDDVLVGAIQRYFERKLLREVSGIRAKGKNASDEYNIPDEYSFSADVILEQLQIIDTLFPPAKVRSSVHPDVAEKRNPPNDTSCPAAKRKKIETEVNSKGVDSEASARATSTSDDHSAKQPLSRLELKESIKRAFENNSDVQSNVVKPISPQPTSSKVTRDIHQYMSVVNPKGQMQKKLDRAAPYNFFLTTITACKETHGEPLSITFQEILDESLGEMESSVQINFMIDIGWLLGNYYFAGYLAKPLLVLYGDETPDLKSIQTKKPQVTAVKVKMDSPFGTHHTKMMLLGYGDGSMRVVVSTANLVEDDWHNRTQGLWISPRCEKLPDDADTASGESRTGFKEDLLRYLVKYNIPSLQPWIVRIRRSDFSAVNVFFVASVPGGHRETPTGHHWGHPKVGRILSKHCSPIDDGCPIVAQSSSIGSLGTNIQSWVGNDIVNSFRKDQKPAGLRKLPPFKMIYPSFSNVKNSHDDLLGGGCLPYRKATNDKQPWLKNHLHQWIASSRHRSHAMPHIKTYCRWSDRGLHWFLLISANLSKAAWGAFNKGTNLDVPLRIMSYEAGVMFLPKFVLDGESVFPLGQSQNNIPPFPLPYDIPLKPYKADDTPFVMDILLG